MANSPPLTGARASTPSLRSLVNALREVPGNGEAETLTPRLVKYMPIVMVCPLIFPRV